MDFRHVFVTLITLFFFPVVDSIDFATSRFGFASENILYRGSAIPSSGDIQFNDPDYTCLVGQAIFSEPVPIWDSGSGKLSDFYTRFSFTIDTLNLPSPLYGDGLAFFLAPTAFQIPPNSAGSYLGLFNQSNYRESSPNQIIVIEFDSYSGDHWDPPYEHVGININSLVSANYTPWNASLNSGDTADVFISYDSKTMMLVASWTYNYPVFPENSTLSYRVNLKDVLPEWVTIGFSASTGVNKERNLLHYWQFNSTLKRTWPSNSSPRKKNRSWTHDFLIAICTFIGTISVAAIAYMIWRRHIRGTTVSTSHHAGLAVRYSYNDLVLATNNFSVENKLGEGGSGDVYKGYLPNSANTQVAVKKISESATEGIKTEYMTEVATISRLTHRNLVQLVGWCQDKTQFLLAYEIMPNGSLDSYLFGEKEPLDWERRYKIVQDLASALLYMHEEYSVHQYIVHRDIKPSNVLLDSEFNAKLGDFGFARFIDNENSGLKSSKVAGTIGYVAPEYMESCKASKESDIYSFGVVVLNVCSGKKANLETEDRSSIGGFTTLVKWVRHLDESGKLRLAADESLKEFDEEEYMYLMKVGLCCTQEVATSRPTIRDVIRNLNLKVRKQISEVKINVPEPHIIDPSSSRYD